MHTSTFTVTCWGCNLSETHPGPCYGEEYEATVADMKSRGWCRREFGPGATPWFCSDYCAHKSHNAIIAEKLWADKEFQEYCNNTSKQMWPALLMLLFVIASIAFMLSECGYVR